MSVKAFLCLALAVLSAVALASACSSKRVEDDRFVQGFRGYAFTLPGPGWQVDPDAWTYTREYGFRVIEPQPSERYFKYSRERSRSDFTRDRLPKTVRPKEKNLFSVDIGFRHVSGKMLILAASTSERDLAQLFRKWHYDSLDPIPGDLIKGYLHVFPEFHPAGSPGALTLTQERFAELGTLHRGDVTLAGEPRTLYGIPLEKDVLILELRAQKDTQPSLLNEGRQALRTLAQSSVNLRKKTEAP